MYRRGQLAKPAVITGVFVALLFVATASAQTVSTSPIVEEQFAVFHNTLARAADLLLSNSAQPPRPASVPPAKSVPPPTAAAGNASNPALARLRQLRPLLEPILQQEGVPADVSAIVMIESGGRPMARSPKGALGLWQLMPETARRYGLTVTSEKDERLDVPKATRAAARYLHDLYGQFGDWELVLAAYNAGEQNIQRAVERAGSKNFAAINWLLPAETRNYVPAVESVLRLLDGDDSEQISGVTRNAVQQVIYASVNLGN